MKQLVQIKPFPFFFWRDFSLFRVSVITPKQFLIYMTMDSSEGRLHFTGGKLSLMWLHWGQLPQRSSGCGPSVRVPAAGSSHLIRVQVVRAILLQTRSVLSHYLEVYSLLPRTSQPWVGLTLTRPVAVRSTLDRGL